MNERIQTDDQVELLTVPPGRFKLRVGQQGLVLLGEEGDLGWRLVTVDFHGARRPHQLHARHLRRVVAPECSA